MITKKISLITFISFAFFTQTNAQEKHTLLTANEKMRTFVTVNRFIIQNNGPNEDQTTARDILFSSDTSDHDVINLMNSFHNNYKRRNKEKKEQDLRKLLDSQSLKIPCIQLGLTPGASSFHQAVFGPEALEMPDFDDNTLAHPRSNPLSHSGQSFYGQY